jgi:hypothetical protein
MNLSSVGILHFNMSMLNFLVHEGVQGEYVYS